MAHTDQEIRRNEWAAQWQGDARAHRGGRGVDNSTFISYSGRGPGGVKAARARVTSARASQPERWSFTSPTACMNE